MGRALDPEEPAQEPAIRVHLVQIAAQFLQALEILRSRVDVECRVAVGSQRKNYVGGDRVCHLSGAWGALKEHSAERSLGGGTIGDEEVLVACRHPLRWARL